MSMFRVLKKVYISKYNRNGKQQMDRKLHTLSLELLVHLPSFRHITVYCHKGEPVALVQRGTVWPNLKVQECTRSTM